jgi:hypothetical protein
MLDSWNDGATKAAVVDFLQRVTTERGPDFVEPALRVAVFDNDGALWCEKPMYIQLDFLIRHDHAEREFDYLAGAERALLDADKHGWTVVSMKNDWSNVFAD